MIDSEKTKGNYECMTYIIYNIVRISEAKKVKYASYALWKFKQTQFCHLRNMLPFPSRVVHIHYTANKFHIHTELGKNTLSNKYNTIQERFKNTKFRIGQSYCSEPHQPLRIFSYDFVFIVFLTFLQFCFI